MTRKIPIIIASLVLVTAVFIILIYRFSNYGTYHCYYYEETYNTTVNNVLKNYDYYKLKLNRDQTFVLTYKSKMENSTEQTAKGTFTINGSSLTLTYTQGRNPIEAMLFPTEKFTIASGKLFRYQTATHQDTGFTTIINQKFIKK